MSDSRSIRLEDLNKIIDDKIKEYESAAEECIQELEDSVKRDENLAKAEALSDLKIDINDPSPIVDTSENIDQTKAVISASKIINNE